MSVLYSSLFALAPVYHCSLAVLLHYFAVSWINKQLNKQVCQLSGQAYIPTC